MTSNTDKENTDNYFENQNDYISDEINCWNWGAFFWNWIWLIPINPTFAIIMCFANMFTCGLSTIILAFYLGIKGNEMAWERKKYRNIEEFQEEQKKWTLTGWICVFIPTFINIVTALLMIMLISASFIGVFSKINNF